MDGCNFSCVLFLLVLYNILGDDVRLFSYMNQYLTDKNFRVSIDDRGINIINYTMIEDFSSNRVVVQYESGVITLIGTDLVISKMLDEELLIVGKLKSIEYN